MELNELPDFVDGSFDYPVSVETVIEDAGDRTVAAPNATDSEKLATILERAGETTYETSNALLTAIRGNLSDEYVGRKFYDDRGTNPTEPDDRRGSSESF